LINSSDGAIDPAKRPPDFHKRASKKPVPANARALFIKPGGLTMKHLYVLGAVLALAACAQQTAPPPAAMAPPPPPPPMAPGPPPMAAAMEPLDGVYVGSLTLQAAGLSRDNLNRSGCVSGRAATAAVRRGIINIEYANWKRHRLHYKGKVDPSGAVTAYHRNSDGSASILNGQISGGQLTGDMQRGPCNYAVALNKR
jgi:hypothetical protein